MGFEEIRKSEEDSCPQEERTPEQEESEEKWKILMGRNWEMSLELFWGLSYSVE